MMTVLSFTPEVFAQESGLRATRPRSTAVVVIATSAIAAVVEVVQALLQRVDIAFVVKVLLAVVLRHSWGLRGFEPMGENAKCGCAG